MHLPTINNRNHVRALILSSEATEIIGQSFKLKRLAGGTGREVWEAESATGRFILRFAAPGEPATELRRELKAAELMAALPVTTPHIRLFESGDRRFSLHPRINGVPFADALYNQFSKPDQMRFVAEVAGFLRDLHAIPLKEAGIELYGDWPGITQALDRWGRPGWFDAVTIESNLKTRLADDVILAQRWREVHSFFASYEPLATDLVFGHGDLHHANLGLEDKDGHWRLAGVFDLGNSGIQNRYDELLRLPLISTQVAPSILDTYDALRAPHRPVDRGVLLLFYRAFLFFLLHLSSDDSYSTHVIDMLQDEYSPLSH
jgi:aminoglycoside phosphotransferase